MVYKLANSNVVHGLSAQQIVVKDEIIDMGVNPAVQYIDALGSKESRRCGISKLNMFAKYYVAGSTYKDFLWFKYLQPRFIHDFLSHGQWKSARSYNCYLSLLKAISREAWSLGQISKETLDRILFIKGRRVERLPAGRAMDQEETKQFYRCIQGNDAVTLRNRAIIALMLGCGLRRAEVSQLRISNINEHTGRVQIIGKGNKERVVFLPKEALEAMNEWLSYRAANKQGDDADAGFVFGHFRKPLANKVDDHGNPYRKLYLDKAIEVCTIGKIVKRYYQDSKLRQIVTPHDLRRTFATRLISKNADIIEVQKLMGHASVITTGNYVRKQEDELEQAAKLWDGEL